MSDPRDVAQRHIEKSVRLWTPRLDLPGIDIEHRFLDTVKEGDETRIADTEVSWPYRHAQIDWWIGHACRFDAAYLNTRVVHENTHVLLGPIADRLKPGSDDLLEFATENVARALLKTAALR